jgi:nicotinamide riboside kinase
MKIAIVGATGTGKSALAAALDITDKTGGVADPWVAAEAPALTEALTRDLLFQDTSFYPQALRQHRQFSLTLLTGLDLPSASLPDGRVRPGLFDQRLRQVMDDQAIPYAVVYGKGQDRTDCALQAIAHHARALSMRFRSARTEWHWNCDTCSDAGCEHLLFRSLLQAGSVRA